MTREEFMLDLREELSLNFNNLTEEEQDILRQNSGTPYNLVLKKVFPTELLSGIKLREPTNEVVRKRGLATR
tara:strand:- start:789 stop:1004 length:216 start_codon:yes stop_codon:yes gene_type:complete